MVRHLIIYFFIASIISAENNAEWKPVNFGTAVEEWIDESIRSEIQEVLNPNIFILKK